MRALLEERGPRLMLLVALIWSVSANIDKIGVRHSSPLLWAAALHTFLAVALLPLVLLRRRGKRLLPEGAKGLVITSYSIHYTKLYETAFEASRKGRSYPARLD